MADPEQPDSFEAGRSDPLPTLRERIPAATPRYLEGALENPALDDDAVLAVIGNAAITQEILVRIADDMRFRRSDEIKRALVFHPLTPPPASMVLAKFLQWRDLLKAADDSQLPQPVRQVAEATLGERMSQLPATEKVRIARGASRGLIGPLLRSRNVGVFQELLLNPRLVESDVLTLSNDHTTPPALLGMLARHGQWCQRPAVRMALLENMSTPLPEAVRLLPTLPLHDLRALVRGSRTRAPIRHEAERLLQSKKKGAGR